MEHKTKVTILAVVGAITLIDLLWRWKLHRNLGTVTAQPAEELQTDPFLDPYQNTNPGIDDRTVNGPQGIAFQGGDISVNVNPNLAQYLSNHYIPLFGFVGFGSH